MSATTLAHRALRAEAAAKGLNRFFTGVPCKKGHLAPRIVTSGKCATCAREWSALKDRLQPERVTKRWRAYHARNPWKTTHRTRQLARIRSARYRLASPGLAAAAKRRYVERHPGRERERVRRSRHARRGRALGGRLSRDLVRRLLELQRGKCACCRVALKLSGSHLDHIEPLARGGLNVDANIQLLCPRCNRQKGARDPIHFMQSRGFLL